MSDTLMFLDIQSIPGDSTIKGFEGQIELETISWGLTVKPTDKAGKVTVELRPQRLTVTKFFDKTSTVLCQYLKQRKVFLKAVLTFARLQILPDGQQAVPIMNMTLVGHCYVEDVKLQASESGKAIAVKETVQFSFRELKLNYYPQSSGRVGRTTAQTFLCDQPCSDK